LLSFSLLDRSRASGSLIKSQMHHVRYIHRFRSHRSHLTFEDDNEISFSVGPKSQCRPAVQLVHQLESGIRGKPVILGLGQVPASQS
jgi:hypothetical protein